MGIAQSQPPFNNSQDSFITSSKPLHPFHTLIHTKLMFVGPKQELLTFWTISTLKTNSIWVSSPRIYEPFQICQTPTPFNLNSWPKRPWSQKIPSTQIVRPQHLLLFQIIWTSTLPSTRIFRPKNLWVFPNQLEPNKTFDFLGPWYSKAFATSSQPPIPAVDFSNFILLYLSLQQRFFKTPRALTAVHHSVPSRNFWMNFKPSSGILHFDSKSMTVVFSIQGVQDLGSLQVNV